MNGSFECVGVESPLRSQPAPSHTRRPEPAGYRAPLGALTRLASCRYNPECFGQELRKDIPMDAQSTIKQQVTSHPVALYMKGTPQFPQCGFSATVVQILYACGVKDFFSVNVLEEPEIRAGHQAIRELADDPAALRQRRVRRRVGHPARDVRVGRTAEAAGGSDRLSNTETEAREASLRGLCVSVLHDARAM